MIAEVVLGGLAFQNQFDFIYHFESLWNKE